jgi:hypothetical protein
MYEATGLFLQRCVNKYISDANSTFLFKKENIMVNHFARYSVFIVIFGVEKHIQ